MNPYNPPSSEIKGNRSDKVNLLLVIVIGIFTYFISSYAYDLFWNLIFQLFPESEYSYDAEEMTWIDLYISLLATLPDIILSILAALICRGREYLVTGILSLGTLSHILYVLDSLYFWEYFVMPIYVVTPLATAYVVVTVRKRLANKANP